MEMADDKEEHEEDPALEAMLGERILDSQPQCCCHYFVETFEPCTPIGSRGTTLVEEGTSKLALVVLSLGLPEGGIDEVSEGDTDLLLAAGNNNPAHSGIDGESPRSRGLETAVQELAAIEYFLQLPEILMQPQRRKSQEELLVDYSKSILVTSEEYLQAMELKVEQKEKARKEAEH